MKPESWLFYVLLGLAATIVGIGIFIDLYSCEQNGTTANMPEMINGLCNGPLGKWLVSSIFWAIGLTNLFAGVNKFRKGKKQ